MNRLLTVCKRAQWHLHRTCEMFQKPKIPLFQLVKNTKQHSDIKSEIIKVYKSNCIPCNFLRCSLAPALTTFCHVTVAQFMCTRNPRMDCACDDSCNFHSSSHCMPLAFVEKELETPQLNKVDQFVLVSHSISR